MVWVRKESGRGEGGGGLTREEGITLEEAVGVDWEELQTLRENQLDVRWEQLLHDTHVYTHTRTHAHTHIHTHTHTHTPIHQSPPT